MTGLNTEGLPTVADKYLSISEIKDEVKSLKEQIEEYLKDTTHEEYKAQMLGRLEVLENNLAAHVKEAKEKDEQVQKQIKQLQDVVAEQQKVINELVNRGNLPPIGTTLPESTPQKMSKPLTNDVHDSGYQSTHSTRSKSAISGEEELKNMRLDFSMPEDDSVAPPTST